MKHGISIVSYVLACLMFACGSSPSGTTDSSSGGSAVSNGGTDSTLTEENGGATDTVTGGASSATGGVISAGGANSTGGVVSKGGSTSTGGSSATGGSVSTVKKINSIAVGVHHTCASLSDGTVWCWGSADYGPLGNATEDDYLNGIKYLSPVKMPISNVVQVVGSQGITWMIKADGTVWSVGGHGFGTAISGNNTRNGSFIPVAVTGITTAVSVSSTNFTGCIVLKNGTIQCWGLGWNGELGIGEQLQVAMIPESVDSITDAVSVSVGEHHSCAIMSSGLVKCWGVSKYLGIGTGLTGISTVNSPTFPDPVQVALSPITVPDISDALTVSIGGLSTCIVRRSGIVSCWSTSYIIADNVPVDIGGISDAVSVASGWHHRCALLATGRIKCWGDGNFGQLGNGLEVNSATPVEVTGIDNAVSVITTRGANHTCALLADGVMKCWGVNSLGELGGGTTDIFSSIPVTVKGLPL